MTAVLPRTVVKRNRRAIRTILSSYGVKAAGVFGSVARSKDNSESDLDLVVQFREDATHDVIGLSQELSTLTDLDVDVIEDVALFRRVRETGIGQRILDETVPL
jgi:uncharacterized protein